MRAFVVTCWAQGPAGRVAVRPAETLAARTARAAFDAYLARYGRQPDEVCEARLAPSASLLGGA